jgi:hypothetical protein
MALVVLPKRKNTKPVVPVISWGHPLAQGLYLYVGYWETGSGPLFDSVRGAQISVSAAPPSWTTGELGPAGSYTYAGATTRYHSIADSSLFTPPFSFAVKWQAVSSPAQRGITSSGNTFGDGSPAVLVAIGRTTGKLDYYNSGYVTGSNPITIGNWYTTVCTYDGVTWLYYLNGAQDATHAVSLTGNRSSWFLGGGFGGTFEGNIEWAAYWKRILVPAEAASLYRHPYGLLQPQSPQRRWWGAVIGGGSLYTQSFSATCNSWSSSFSRSTAKQLPGMWSSWVAGLSKANAKVLAATMAACSAGITRKTALGLQAIASTWSAAVSAVKGAGLFTMSFTASMAAWSASTIKATSHSMAATTAAFSGGIVKSVRRGISASMTSFAGSVSKRLSRPVNAILASWSALLSRFSGNIVTPASRTFSVAPDSRLFLIPADNRQFIAMGDTMPFPVSKSSVADLDYQIDWSQWLGSDTIISSTWTVDPDSGLTAHSDSVSGGKTTVWLSGGSSSPVSYHLVVNRITTAAGRTDQRSLLVHIVDR